MDTKSGDLIDRLDEVLLGFRAECLSDENLHRGPGGEITVHGAWAFRSGWLRDQAGSIGLSQVEALAAILNAQVGGNDPELDNAAATCFLENLAGDPAVGVVGQSAIGRGSSAD